MAAIIPSGQFSPQFTGAIRKKFDELGSISVNNYFSSKFPVIACPERFPIIEVRRGTEKVAIDVPMGSMGIRTQITNFSQKAYDPYNFDLWFDATELECYFYSYGSDAFSINQQAALANGIAVHTKANHDMIMRARELMAVSILETGKITSLRDGSIIDYKRNPLSFPVNAAGNQWTDEGSDPFADLKADCDFLRSVGKSSSYYVNATFGTDAWTAFRKNSTVKERLKEFNNKRDLIPESRRNTAGDIFQMEIDCDSYKIRCFTYNEFYDDPASTVAVPLPQKSFKNPKTVILEAENAEYATICGAIPQVGFTGQDTSSLICAEYAMADFRNAEMAYHRFHIKSRPIPVPVTVDRMITRKPIA